MTIREANEAERLLREAQSYLETDEAAARRCGYEYVAANRADLRRRIIAHLSRPEPQAVSGETPETDAVLDEYHLLKSPTLHYPAEQALTNLARSLERRLREAEERGSKFQAAIEWALGQGDSDFEPRRPNDPPYYWRTKLRKLAFGSLTYNKETRTISTEAAERRPSVREAQEEVREACARLIEDFKTGGSDAETVTYWGKTLAEVIRSLDLSKVGGAR